MNFRKKAGGRYVLGAVLGATVVVLGVALPVANAAQPSAPPRRSDSILVTSDPIRPQEVRERVSEFIRQTGVAGGDLPAARWVDPVCPRVAGLTDEGARAAEARMRAVAEEAGIRVAPAPCNANIVVTFASDAGGVVREVNRLAPSRLAALAPNVREELMTGSAPIRWWYAAETRGRYGEAAGANPQGGFVGSAPGPEGGTGSTMSGTGVMQYESSLVSTLSNRVLIGASVVIDQDDVMGMRLNDLADYAALVAFAEIRAVDSAPAGSILSLFSAAERPRGLTSLDRAFLRALYRMPLDREARHHRGVLRSEMIAAATGSSDEAN